MKKQKMNYKKNNGTYKWELQKEITMYRMLLSSLKTCKLYNE